MIGNSNKNKSSFKGKRKKKSEDFVEEEKKSNSKTILVAVSDFSMMSKEQKEEANEATRNHFEELEALGDSIFEKDVKKIPSNNFLKKLETSLEKFNNEDVLVDGTIISISPDTILLNIGKDDVFVDPKKDGIDIETLSVGETMRVYVERKKGEILGSISKAIREQVRLDMEASLDSKEKIPFTGTVVESIHGGYWMTIAGNKVFLPGSLAALSKLDDFKSLVGEEVTVYIVNKEKGALVASRRDYLKDLSIEKSKSYKDGDIIYAAITGFNQFGIFVEIEDGIFAVLSHSSCDEETSNLSKERKLEKGMTIKAWIKEKDHKGRLVLTQKQDELSPWIYIESLLPLGSIVEGVIRRKKDSVFIDIAKGISGKLSKHDKVEDLESGKKIPVVVMSIDKTKREIYLKRHKS